MSKTQATPPTTDDPTADPLSAAAPASLAEIRYVGSGKAFKPTDGIRERTLDLIVRHVDESTTESFAYMDTDVEFSAPSIGLTDDRQRELRISLQRIAKDDYRDAGQIAAWEKTPVGKNSPEAPRTKPT